MSSRSSNIHHFCVDVLSLCLPSHIWFIVLIDSLPPPLSLLAPREVWGNTSPTKNCYLMGFLTLKTPHYNGKMKAKFWMLQWYKVCPPIALRLWTFLLLNSMKCFEEKFVWHFFPHLSSSTILAGICSLSVVCEEAYRQAGLSLQEANWRPTGDIAEETQDPMPSLQIIPIQALSCFYIKPFRSPKERDTWRKRWLVNELSALWTPRQFVHVSHPTFLWLATSDKHMESPFNVHLVLDGFLCRYWWCVLI
jgi:hypothetical protein